MGLANFEKTHAHLSTAVYVNTPWSALVEPEGGEDARAAKRTGPLISQTAARVADAAAKVAAAGAAANAAAKQPSPAKAAAAAAKPTKARAARGGGGR